MEFNSVTKTWGITSIESDDGGSIQLATQLGNSVSEKLNEIAKLVRSTDLSFSDDIRIGHYEGHLRNGDGSDYAMTDLKAVFGAIVAAIKGMSASDGDLKALRILDLGNLETALAGLAADEAFSLLYSRLRIATDYQYYLENTEYINQLMVTSPSSDLAKSWFATIGLATSAGLDEAYIATGGGGNNIFLTSDGKDTIDGGAGNDTIRSYGENDLIQGGDGNDLISGGIGADSIDGGAGIDTLTFDESGRGASLDLGQGIGLSEDALGDVYSNIENVTGSRFADQIIGSEGANEINGASGNDLLKGSDGNDILMGAVGDDAIYGDMGDAQANGGDDQLYGGDGNDTLHADGGSDVLDGGVGLDIASYEVAHGAVTASLAASEALTGRDRDQFSSIEGLTGSAFGDELTGDDQANVLKGGHGADTLDGGRGNDTYSYSLGDGSDVIRDYQSDANTDQLVLAGIQTAEVKFRHDAKDNLVITFADHSQVTIEKQFLGDLTYDAIEQITFANGVVLDLAGIRAKTIADMKATGEVVGTDFAETYYHTLGDGSYVIEDWDSAGCTDQLVLNGVGANGFSLSQDEDGSLLVRLSNGEVLKVYGQFQSDNNWWGIEQLVLGDGSIMDSAAIRARLISDMRASGSVVGTAFADAYVHHSGDGSYTIYDYDPDHRPDSLTFSDLSSTQVSLVQDGNNLRIITNTGETITVLQQFASHGYDSIESLQFSDGVTWQASDLAAHLTTLGAVQGQLIGTTADNSYLSGASTGSIRITDYNYFGGNDVLQFADQTSADLIFSRSGNDLILTRSDGASVTISRQLDDNQAYSIEQILFADGSTMSAAQIRDRLVSDMKSGGQVVGTANDETYRHVSGDGSYSISDYKYGTSNDSLILQDSGAGEIHLSRSGDDLVINLAGGETITVLDQLDGSLDRGIEHLTFDDGTSLSEGGIRDRLVADMKGSGRVVGTSQDEHYAHSLGDGSYTISDYSYGGGADTLTLSDASPVSARFARSGNDLQVILSNGEVITLERQLDENLRFGIETLVFSDGTTLTAAEMRDRMVSDMKHDGLSVGTENNETYRHTSGDGSWMIRDYDYDRGADRLVFTDLTAAQVSVGRQGNSLVLHLPNGEAITILNQLDDSLRSSIEFFEFSDGTILTEADIRNRMVSDMKVTGEVVGTENSEVYTHTAGDGSHRITDYDYSKGADRLIFTDLTAQQVELSRAGDDLIMKLSGGEVVTIVGQLDPDGRNAIETFEYADGSSMTAAQMLDKLAVDMRASGLVVGSPRGDVFTHHAGDGSYAILDSAADLDRLEFVDLSASEASMARNGDDLVITIVATGEAVTITKYFVSPEYKITSISFADGMTLTSSQLDEISTWHMIFGSSFADTLVGQNSVDSLSGGAGNDVLFGGDGDDILNGGSGADTMSGGLGDDAFIVDDTSDTLIENLDEGVDSVASSVSWVLGAAFENLTLVGSSAISGQGNSLANTLNGNGGANSLSGLDGNDSIYGAGGNDTLDGGAGADLMQGGDGSDTYYVDNIADVVIETDGAGVDLVLSSVSWVLDAATENLTLTGVDAIHAIGNSLGNVLAGNSGANHIEGREGDDTISAGAGNDTLDGGTGADSLTGGAGDDLYLIDEAGDSVAEDAGAGNDTVQSSVSFTLAVSLEHLVLTGDAATSGFGNASNNALTGNQAANLLSGAAGGDTLYGGDGADTLDGGSGADAMTGGLGDDIYLVDDQLDVITENFGEGNDAVQSSIAWTLAAEFENLTLTGSGAINGIGNSYANAISGNSGANSLAGLDGDDTLSGGGGNDTLDGGLGVDLLIGGAGNDTFLIDFSADVVQENAGEGTDLVIAAFTFALGSDVENLTLSGGLAIDGTGNGLANSISGNAASNNLSGQAGNDTISAGDGNDTLDGGAGNDSMTGGLGDDLYLVDSATDKVVELSGEGNDLVQSSVSWILGSNLENLTLLGTADISATGNTVSNVIMGNLGSNLISAGGGNDTLYGGDGNDTLDGETGSDSMIGGLGDDVFVVDNSGDLVEETAGQGVDLVQSAVAWTLAANFENLTITGATAIAGTGNEVANILIGAGGANLLSGLAGDDMIYGNAGADTLDGGSGNDSMFGGLGDDTFIVDSLLDAVSEAAGEGTDTVQTSLSYVLGAQIEKLTLTGLANLDGTGNALANRLDGNAGANLLAGLEGDDTISAGDGADTLDGGSGADSMTGGLGNDLYIVDNAGDKTVELSTGGTDTVQSSITFTLSTSVETLTLTGSSTIDGYGNSGANTLNGNSAANGLYGGSASDTLYGSAGNDTLDGGAGTDSMIGGTGDDIYMVDISGDSLTEAASEGTDTVQSSVTWTLATNFENLTLSGSSGLSGTGNALANVIIGNTGANALSGLAGNDTMTGGAGNDSLSGGTGADQFVFSTSGNGIDVVSDFNELDGGGEEGDVLRFAAASKVGVFVYLGTGAFTGGSDNSEARISGNQVLVDANGDGTAEITLTLTGLNSASQLAASDFLFA